MRTRILYSVIVLCALIPGGRAPAQGTGASATAKVVDSNIGYLGIENLRCNCTISYNSNPPQVRYTFRSEPMILGVIPGSPGSGILMRGDTIVQIDGYPLLSSEGARRFSNIEPGDDVNFLLRRRGNLIKVTLRAIKDPGHRVYSLTPEVDRDDRDSYFPATPPMPAGAASRPTIAGVPTPSIPAEAPRARVWAGAGVRTPQTPRPAAGAAPSLPPGVPDPAVIAQAPRALAAGAGWLAATVPSGAPSPRGWFGFSIRCSNCGWASSGRPGESPVWESDEPPELSRVDANSPAGRAGLRVGDRITHINGVSILTDRGRKMFGSVMPGQRVRLTVSRGGTSLVRELTLASRPEVRAAIAASTPRAATPPSMRRSLRYSGKLDDVTVEVFSAGGPTVERVGDTMIITVGGSVVRLKVGPQGK
jgi:membrane-associated protease RseP (regulator of RpoE activity)